MLFTGVNKKNPVFNNTKTKFNKIIKVKVEINTGYVYFGSCKNMVQKFFLTTCVLGLI